MCPLIQSNVEGILEDLTDDDIRIIMETEDEVRMYLICIKIFNSHCIMYMLFM